MNIGYDKQLYILPFDHRSSFLKGMFGVSDREPNPEEMQKVKDAKHMIYEAFLQAVEKQIPKDSAAILVDEEYGEEILKDAGQKGFVTMLTTEKSGQDEFAFEYGQDFGEHLNTFRPTFAKALVRYNPDADKELNKKQLETLRQLSDFCHANGYRFLVEPLIPPTEEQLQSVAGDKHRFDTELRPSLAIQMINEFQDSHVEPDIWKIEGMEEPAAYEKTVAQAKAGGREDVGIVILGRGAGVEQVKQWLRAGRSIPGIVGFAVGRTVFWKPLVTFYKGEVSREDAIEEIAVNYETMYRVFMTGE